MNVVTFETAKRLKEAGFPQPEIIKDFNCAYTKEGRLFCVPDGFMAELVEMNKLVFAPSATDILKELGYSFELWYDHDRGSFCLSHGEYGTVVPNANPAEACAEVWLSHHHVL